MGPVIHVVAYGHPVLPNHQWAGSHPGTITRSLSWPAMAGTSWDVALEEPQGPQDAIHLTLSPNRGIATSVGSTTPAGCWPIPCHTCPLFLSEAHLHQCPPIVALLTARIYL